MNVAYLDFPAFARLTRNSHMLSLSRSIGVLAGFFRVYVEDLFGFRRSAREGRAEKIHGSISVLWSVVSLEVLPAEEVRFTRPPVRKLSDSFSAERRVVYGMGRVEMLITPEEGSCISKLNVLVDNADSCPMNETNGHSANNVLAGSRTG